MGIQRSDIEQEVYSDSWAGRAALAGDAVCGKSFLASMRILAQSALAADSWPGRAALAGDAVCGQSVMASGGVAESAFAAVPATGLEPNQRGNFSLGT